MSYTSIAHGVELASVALGGPESQTKVVETRYDSDPS